MEAVPTAENYGAFFLEHGAEYKGKAPGKRDYRDRGYKEEGGEKKVPDMPPAVEEQKNAGDVQRDYSRKDSHNTEIGPSGYGC